jgi:flavorubredoxin
MKITADIENMGVEDREIDLFEGMYPVPNGVTYNSYLITDEKIAVLDSVDGHFTAQWLKNLSAALDGRQPDYLIINHMEPDHSASVLAFAEAYPSAQIVGNAKTFAMLAEYFGTAFEERRVVVKDGETLSLGKHTLTFVFTPLVHWPEVMMTYDDRDKTLFSADAFGTFGIPASPVAPADWADEARRYYIGIVGKYGVQVQGALKKLSAYTIERICPLHGSVLQENLEVYLELYGKWSSYTAEKEGVMIGYTSVYGHTKAAAELLVQELKKRGTDVVVYDLARTDRSLCVAEAFRYSKLVLATTTYNGDIFPAMREFIDCLIERNYQNRTVGLMENGSWAPLTAKLMTAKFEKSKNITFAETSVKIRSALSADSRAQVVSLAEQLSK